MGREWSWAWGGRSSSTTRRAAERETSSGCMTGVLHQLFDFHQFRFPLHRSPCFKTPDSFLQEDPTILKGVEAPRNSIESEEGRPSMGTVPLSSIVKEGDLNLPIEIRLGMTKVDNARLEEISSETSTSPATKTPSLVARLMGLDLLPPDNLSPASLSSSSVHASTRSRGGKPHKDQNLEEKNACTALKRDLRSRRSLHCRSNSNNTNFMMETEVRYEVVRGSRSLPDTPRMSYARRSADADPRLSLHINKENLMIPPEEFSSARNSFSCSPYSKKKEWSQGEENRSPSHYARQIVKQVKESVGRRKVGLHDITNITRNRANEGDSPTMIKSQKTRRLSLTTKMGDHESRSPSKHSSMTPSSSCSPRLRFLEPKNKPATSTSINDQSSYSPRPSLKPLLHLSPSQQQTPSQADNQPRPKAPRKPRVQALNQQHSMTKCKKGSSSSSISISSNKRFTQLRLTKPPQISETVRNMRREEAFVRSASSPATTKANNLSVNKKCKKTPLSNDLVNIAVPSVVPLKKEHQDSSSSTTQQLVAQGSKRSSQLSSCLSRKYKKQEETKALAHQDDNNKGNNSGGGGGAEFRYVSRILRSTGIYKDDAFVSITTTRWFSPCHPLNPLIFHHLENSFPYSSKIEGEEEEDDEENNGGRVEDLGQLRHRCNRKLLFQLVDENLVDVLRPYLNTKPWGLRWIEDRAGLLPVVSFISKDTPKMTGLQLLERLWSRIQSFPAANCQILQDIDALVEKDLPPDSNMLNYSSEEGESIVFEIERDIIDSLLHDTVAAYSSNSSKRENRFLPS